MAPSLEISIPSTSSSTATTGSKPFTVYSISLRQPIRSYVVQKRYSDFVQLHADLKRQAGQLPPEPLPKKSWIKSTVSSPELTEARRKALETYLRAINDSADPRWRQTHAWKQFLSLPGSAMAQNEAHAAGHNSSGPRHTDLQAAIIDPNVWLDVHRELKNQLSEARQALRKRDAAVSAQEQHEASANVKRWLVRSGTVIIALEAGLSASSGANTGKAAAPGSSNPVIAKPSQIGEGEIRRRKDLLSAARKERDGLERQLNLQAVRRSNSPSVDRPATPNSSEQNQSQSGNQSSSDASRPVKPQTGRRVLGAPLKETEQTRELDNDGVLQLQQQIMQAQDEDVTALTKVVGRIKEMGIHINEELDLQNEMLRVLDGDLDRVTSKMDIAKKRVDKIN